MRCCSGKTIVASMQHTYCSCLHPTRLAPVLPDRMTSGCNAAAAPQRGSKPMLGEHHTAAFLNTIGVPELKPATSPFDPGYDPLTLEAHLAQSAHLMSTLKISMACWLIAAESATRRKIGAARRHGVPTVTGGGPFEVAVAQGALPAYLDLCADMGLTRIECGEGFVELKLRPEEIVSEAGARGLEVEFELGEKHAGSFTDEATKELIDTGK